MNKYIFSSLAIASVLASYPLAARGATILATASCGNPDFVNGTVTCTANIPPNPLPQIVPVPWARITIPKYDSNAYGGAPLEGIDLNADVGFDGIYRITNDTNAPLIYGRRSDEVGVEATISDTGSPSPLELNPEALDNIGTGTLGPLQFRDFAVQGEDSKQTTVNPAQLDDYAGDGTVEFSAQLERFFNVSANQNFSQNIDAAVYLNLVITYKFNAPPPTEIDEPNLGAFSILACVVGALFLSTRKNKP